MSSTMSKRNQARNEQALQELIRNVAGNDRCADCQARNPGWASWSLGIFLCMRCAALHRKLGTHISKVKSLSMDSWTNDQVETMKAFGNTKSNEIWNPQRKRAPIPLDVDEVDSAMERFIRQKYEQKAFMLNANKSSNRQPASFMAPQRDRRADSPVSIDDNPPPPPPKPGRKFTFGLRSSSSASFLSRGSKEDKYKKGNVPEPMAFNKQTKTYGTAFEASGTNQGVEMKLIQLRDMGFSDSKRNTSILQANNGNLDKTVEALIKLGATSRSQTPILRTSKSKPNGLAAPREPESPNGASVVPSLVFQKQTSPLSSPPATRSNNPFETINQNVSATSAFDAAMANMRISSPQPQAQPQPQSQQQQQQQQQQSLFPNSTGGYATFEQQHQQQQQQQQSPYQQSMTPPVPQTQQYINNPYAQTTSHNPFMASQQISSPTASNNPYMQAFQQSMSPNPSVQQATQNQMFSPQFSSFSSPGTMSNPPTPQQHYPQSNQQGQQAINGYGSPAYQNVQSPTTFTPQSPASYYNPYEQQQQQQQQQEQQQHSHQMMAQQTGKLDKNSILALYNLPQSPTMAQSPSDRSATPLGHSMQSPVPFQPMVSPQRSATMPIGSSNNPFASMGSYNPAPSMPYH